MGGSLTGNLSGRTCLVSGASSGIGKQTALELARRGARVVLACRSVRRGEAARREIVSATGSAAVEVMEVDLADQTSIRRFGKTFLERYPALHVLVNNAGIWSTRRRLSPAGIELTWATNVLGYFLLTELLLERLQGSAPARIVNVASRRAGELDLSDVQFQRRPYSGVSAYSQSKQADRMLTWALARRLEGSGVTANALHPGMVRTAIFRKGGGPLGWIAALYSKLFGLSVAAGADTVVWLAASPAVEGMSGKFWSRRKERACRFRDPEAEEKLWRLCASMTAG